MFLVCGNIVCSNMHWFLFWIFKLFMKCYFATDCCWQNHGISGVSVFFGCENLNGLYAVDGKVRIITRDWWLVGVIGKNMNLCTCKAIYLCCSMVVFIYNTNLNYASSIEPNRYALIDAGPFLSGLGGMKLLLLKLV